MQYLDTHSIIKKIVIVIVEASDTEQPRFYLFALISANERDWNFSVLIPGKKKKVGHRLLLRSVLLVEQRRVHLRLLNKRQPL